MKPLFSFFWLFCCLSMFAFSAPNEQKLKNKQLPAALQKSFSEKFLNAKKTKWYKNEEGFRVSFFSDGIMLHAFYNSNGVWQKTHLYISQLPPELIKNHFGSFYGDWVIRKKIKVESLAAVYYLLEAHYNDMIRELLYDESGGLLKENIIQQ